EPRLGLCPYYVGRIMQWSRKGAHYLLQTRTAVLNNELQDKFASWYPGCTIDAQSRGTLSAMAA
ncbi:hypothetical protein F3O03_004580, partial [Escherichia coli]|nr:hypothetical protein [Escherichia coli]EFK6941487.1 hypothetical protein [Escherichia coli]EFK7166232.1 hypothetical protein [Escherichia coli]EGP3301329.1 hypothetical protein [Escherichia coli]EHW8445379.1 hypothetical protein [Escherichia coli]